MPNDSPATKTHLKDMITNLIDDNVDGARESFHSALQLKMQGILNPSTGDEEVDLDTPVGDLDDDDSPE